ncbi:hypothetical protein L7F22_008902 [Adiantum nelumboides]|nr:hypothetical protein [Adiantum nelumboides]
MTAEADEPFQQPAAAKQPTSAPSPSKRVTISHLEGTLLRDSSFFPYYMLVALEAGGPLRAALLLLLHPLALLFPDSLSIQLHIFIATAGLPISSLRAAAAAVLPKFFLDDLDPTAYPALLKYSDSSRCVVTSHPHILVDHFLKAYLQVDTVIASELQVTGSGICTGLLAKSGLLFEDKKLEAVKVLLDNTHTGYGICDVNGKQHTFLSLCQETAVISQSRCGEKVPKEDYLTPLVFHDGRFVTRPTPLTSLTVALWFPIGMGLAIARILIGLSLPQELAFPLSSFLGVRLRVKGAPPVLVKDGGSTNKEGVLFVCVHRTLADPIFLAMALRRKVRAVVFSVSKLSECLSPIRTTRLTRNRELDTKIIDGLLENEDLCVCPEGTTCREPFLLRFSPLFADLADCLVPVAVNVKTNMFHGTSARGFKSLDGIFLAMNPRISYDIAFLEPIAVSPLRESGKTAVEIANLVQKQLAVVLGFECTNFNRKDKYSFLAGHDGNMF